MSQRPSGAAGAGVAGCGGKRATGHGDRRNRRGRTRRLSRSGAFEEEVCREHPWVALDGLDVYDSSSLCSGIGKPGARGILPQAPPGASARSSGPQRVHGSAWYRSPGGGHVGRCMGCAAPGGGRDHAWGSGAPGRGDAALLLQTPGTHVAHCRLCPAGSGGAIRSCSSDRLVLLLFPVSSHYADTMHLPRAFFNCLVETLVCAA